MPINGNDIRVQKAEIRDQSKLLRNSLSSDDKHRLDQKIANRLLNLWYFREAELLLSYVSNSIEVDSRFIIRQALDQGKLVAVPRCVEGTRNIDFYIIKSLDELSEGSFGIYEPSENKINKLMNFSNCICIVPALSFDLNGYRIGYGKGYYDRFFSKKSLITIGICYDACVYKDLPHGKYDKKIDIIVTESRIINLNKY